MPKFKPYRKNQFMLFPESIDDYAPENNLSRMISNIVEKLDTKDIEDKYSSLGQNTEKLTISPGYVHLIRFIRSDLVLDIFGEKYIMPQDVEYEYVWATIDTAKEKLFVYHDSKLVVEYPYLLPKSSIDLSRFDL